VASFDYAEIQATVLNLLTEFGSDFTFLGFDPTLADNTKPWNGPSDARAGAGAASTTQIAVLVPPSGLGKLGQSFMVEDLEKRPEQILVVAGVDGVDLSNYNEVDNGSLGPLKIVAIQKLIPDGSTNILWFIGVKR